MRLYKHEITAFLGNATAATQGFLEIDAKTNLPVHYLRTEAPLTPEVLSTYPRRLSIQRTNPYFAPQGYADVASTLESFETRQCSSGVTATLPDRTATINNPDFNVRTDGDLEAAADYYDRIKLFAFNDQDSTATIQAAPCNQQGPVPVDRLAVGAEPVPAHVPVAVGARTETFGLDGGLNWLVPAASRARPSFTYDQGPTRAQQSAPAPSGGEVIRRSRFVVAIGLVVALGVSGLAFADGATENDVTVLGKVSPKKLDKKKYKPITLYSGVTTSTTHAVPGQQNAEKVTVEYPKNVKFDLKAAPTLRRAAARHDDRSGQGRLPGQVEHRPRRRQRQPRPRPGRRSTT